MLTKIAIDNIFGHRVFENWKNMRNYVAVEKKVPQKI